MHEAYRFVSGPMVWAAFAVFVLGSTVKLARLHVLAHSKDAAVFVDFKAAWGVKSILHWLFPFNVTAKASPWVTGMGFVFHVCFLLPALFLSAHVTLWEWSWGVSWPTLPDAWSDALAMVFLAAAAFFIVRRAAVPQIKVLSTGSDWLVLILAIAPMLTGFLAYRQWGDYQLMIVLHIAAGNILLIAVPFTKLSHMYLFFLSRLITGSDFGKRNVGAW